MTDHGFDGGLLAAFVFAPVLAAAGWLYLLAGREPLPTLLAVWVLMFVAVRPVVWDWGASRDGLPERRAAVYRERQAHSANTAFIAAAMIGLATLDVIKLPGAPYWTDQPRASFALGAVAIYLIWLAQKASIPAEVGAGWRRLLGR